MRRHRSKIPSLEKSKGKGHQFCATGCLPSTVGRLTVAYYEGSVMLDYLRYESSMLLVPMRVDRGRAKFGI